MGAIKFYINLKKGKTEGILYISVKPDNGKRLSLSLKERVKEAQWDFRRQQAKRSRENYREFNAMLDQIKVRVERGMLEAKGEGRAFIKADLARAVFGSAESGSPEVIELFEAVLERESGRLKPASLAGYRVFLADWRAFVKARGAPVLAAEVSARTLGEFEQFLLEKGNNNITIDKKFRQIKTFGTWLANAGKPLPYDIKQYKLKLKQARQSKWHLTDSELRQFMAAEYPYSKREADLGLPEQGTPPALARARDVFVFGCFTGLRYGDLARLRPDSLQILEETEGKPGTPLLRLVMQKTDAELLLPVPEPALKIWQRYGGKLPVISNQKLNAQIKQAAKAAGLDRRIETRSLSGAKQTTKVAPLWAEISMHRARNTFISLAYKAGVPQRIVQAMAGHSDARITAAYYDVMQEDKAEAARKLSALG